MDYLVRSIDRGQNFRIFSVVTNCITETARERHDTWPVATAALGRTLTGALLLGANLKGNDMLTLRIMGDGPLGLIIVSANARGEVRGYVQEPHVDLPRRLEGKLPVGDAVGKGILYVTKDLGLKEPFSGSVEIISGEIAEDLTHYLVTSEQTPSAVSLGVLVNRQGRVSAAGGFWLEMLPGAEREVVRDLEERLACLPPVSTIIEGGASPEDIARTVAGKYELKILEKTPVYFRCPCSIKKVESVLISLGGDEIRCLMEEKGGAEVRCHFCGEVYNFSAADLEKLIKEISA